MNYGPLIFLTSFLALSASWFGFVLTPQIQIGRQPQGTNSINPAELYPQARPGLAAQGLQVYRANGCAACHSQQVGQTGTVIDVRLLEAGTNAAAVAAALVNANVGISTANAAGLLTGLPKTILSDVSIDVAKLALKALEAPGAKGEIKISPVGADIARGWGRRRTVATDYLFDQPVQLGSQRVGPDLANAGARLPDLNWHLLHLYSPQKMVPGSLMPPYRFLFQVRKIEQQAAADALRLPKEIAPPEGYEVVPKPEAVALAAYLVSLNANTPLFETPMTVAPATTNSPAK